MCEIYSFHSGEYPYYCMQGYDIVLCTGRWVPAFWRNSASIVSIDALKIGALHSSEM